MTDSPELDDFRKRIEELRSHKLIAPLLKRGEVRLAGLTLDNVAALTREGTASYYFLIAAAGLNRTTLKKAVMHEEAKIVTAGKRKAFAIKNKLPMRTLFADVATEAVALRRGDLERKSRGGIEALFRERLAAEAIPILMSPPHRQIPGILVGRRKPDGVYPDPATHAPPLIYLEIKNVRRVSDDIQKRLYEIAEAAIEMKFLYGTLRLDGLNLTSTRDVIENPSALRAQLRAQIVKSTPKVVALMLCAKSEAERYREGAEAFVDRVFFQEEIEECLAFLKAAVDGGK